MSSILTEYDKNKEELYEPYDRKPVEQELEEPVEQELEEPVEQELEEPVEQELEEPVEQEDKKEKQDTGFCFTCLFTGCKKSYPMVKRVPEINNILSAMLPESMNINDMNARINSINDALSYVTPESTAARLADTTLKTAVSAVSAIIGADSVVNLVITIKDAITLIVKIFGILATVMSTIGTITDPEQQNNTVRLIYDIFHINFDKGPKGVECHMKYILNEYKKMGVDISVVCNIFTPLYDAMMTFLGSLLSSIPMVAGTPRVAIQILTQSKMVRNIIIGRIIKLFKNTYKKLKNKSIPKDVQNMFEDPKALANYMNCLLVNKDCSKEMLKQQKGIIHSALMLAIPSINPMSYMRKAADLAGSITSKSTRYIAGKSEKFREYMEKLSENIGFIAFIISKVFIITLALLYVFKSC